MHNHTCWDCGAVIEHGDFDCEFDRDHDNALCDHCLDSEMVTVIDLNGAVTEVTEREARQHLATSLGLDKPQVPVTREYAVERLLAIAADGYPAQYAVVPTAECRGVGTADDMPFQLASFDEQAGGYIGFWGLDREMTLAEALADYDDVIELVS